MSLEKPNSKPTTKERQDKDKQEYARLVEEIQKSLEHRSPGLFGWWDDLVDTATDIWDDAVDWTDNIVDTYIWDTSEAEAELESWVRDTFEIPDEQGKGFAEEVLHRADEEFEDLVWDTSDKEGAIESWVRDTFDIPDEQGKGFVEEATGKVEEIVDDMVDDTIEKVIQGGESVDDVVTRGGNIVRDTINNVSFALGASFETAMSALTSLPDMLLNFKGDLANWFKFDLEEFTTSVNFMRERKGE